jgi:hypothetical protein
MKHLTLASIAVASTILAASPASSAPYQQYRIGACGTASTCNLVFTTVPAGKTAQIENVSCYGRTAYGPELKKLQLQVLSSSGAVLVSVALPPAPYILGSSNPSTAQTLSVLNQPVTLYATGGQKFRVSAELTKGRFAELNCHISGKI